MPEYLITLREVFRCTATVEAKSEAEALKKFNRLDYDNMEPFEWFDHDSIERIETND